ncbi:Acetate kinase [Roseovarius litorisediminis]|uniref:Acetate kinase n=2 Tax=Roseovarius litorisediminis TaxID=1312363 RepID=A0A1Y5S417_9RHOB|nr:Acetate kinase [Roseovarius litorisediminis]
MVINAGSSSIKFAVFGTDIAPRLTGRLESLGSAPRLSAKSAEGRVVADEDWSADHASGVHVLIQRLMNWLEDHLGAEAVVAIGHRVAIGGLEHSGPALVTPELLVKLKALVPLAPLHQPRNLEPIESLGASHPHVPQVVCFDTAFHQTLPRVAQMYALPKALRDAGAHRYGFHGLSYEYIASRLPDIDQRGATDRTIVAHLGSGASMCALRSGRSIATTMGFSPLSGLVMGTRPGDLDPGLMIWLIRECGMSVDQIEATLYHDAGLKGVSGISGDMRQLLASDTPEASEAVELFAYKAATEVGALTAALGGLDTLVFTAGIGERSPEVRAMICARCKWLGLEVSMARNQAGSSTISTPDSRVAVHVIATNEELMVARHTIDLVLKRMLKESVQ